MLEKIRKNNIIQFIVLIIAWSIGTFLWVRHFIDATEKGLAFAAIQTGIMILINAVILWRILNIYLGIRFKKPEDDDEGKEPYDHFINHNDK